MKIAEIISGLGRPVAFYPGLARLLGSVNAAIFLGQLLYWWDKKDHDYIYKTSNELEAETGLSYKEQRFARRLLVSLGVLTEKHHRIQHEMHFRLHLEALDCLWKSRGAPALRAVREMPSGQLANSPEVSSGTALRAVRSQRVPRDYPETTPENTKKEKGGRTTRSSSSDVEPLSASSPSPPLFCSKKDKEKSREARKMLLDEQAAFLMKAKEVGEG